MTRIAKLSGNLKWPDNMPFNGNALFVLVIPTTNGSTENPWPALTLMEKQIPLWTPIKITEGVFDQNAGLIFNDDIVPHNSEYAAYYFDDAGVLAGEATGTFPVDEYVVTPPVSITKTPTESTLSIPLPA